MMTVPIGTSLVVALALLSSTEAKAACSWSFNWYCTACAKIGGRTTGVQSGYGSYDQCESARRSVAREVTTGSCTSSGICDSPRAGGGRSGGYGRPTPGEGGSVRPEIDAEEVAIRRAEEERMRLEAEEAERRAREKAEEDRRQRQFMADKLDALKSLKGSNFDGGGSGLELKGMDDPLPLKSGSPTLGIKPNSGSGSATESGMSVHGESRFSKGNRFSAPVDLRTKDPAGPLQVDAPTSRELIPDGKLGQFLGAQDWPPLLKAQTAIAFDDLERGRPGRASETLAAASKALPQDLFLKQASAASAAAARNAPLQFDPERLRRELSKEAYMAYVVGWEYLQQGNMNGAARMFGRALDATPKNSMLQLLVVETEKRRHIPAPAEQQAENTRREIARDYAQSQAALRLGLNAAAWNKPLALSYLDEAGNTLSSLDWAFVRMVREDIAKGRHTAPGSYPRLRYRNRGEAMLDALDYGKGDWAASLRYLKHVGQIQKGNPVVDAAHRELEQLSRSAEPQ